MPLSSHSWSPVVSWEVEFCWRRVLRFQRVILHCETGSGMPSHLREAGLTRMWWIQGAISATLTVVGVDKIITKGPFQWGFNDYTFHSFTQRASSGLYGCVVVVRLIGSLFQTQSLVFERVNQEPASVASGWGHLFPKGPPTMCPCLRGIGIYKGLQRVRLPWTWMVVKAYLEST
jgi:hypothetical protein